LSNPLAGPGRVGASDPGRASKPLYGRDLI
jgi:hypothetical protein